MITNFITYIIIILNLKKNIFKINLTLFTFIILGVISTLLIRLDFVYNILKNLHFIDQIFICLISCFFSFYLIINLIYLRFKYIEINFIYKYNNII